MTVEAGDGASRTVIGVVFVILLLAILSGAE